MADEVTDDSGERSVSVRTTISASAERVWSLISDVELLPRFSEELLSVAWIGDDRGLGARFTGTNFHPAMGQWTTQCQITQYMPPTLFGWSVGDPALPAARWRFDVLAVTSSSCVLSQTAELGPGRSGVTMLIDRDPAKANQVIAGRLDQFRTNMHATVVGIKELAEAAAIDETGPNPGSSA